MQPATLYLRYGLSMPRPMIAVAPMAGVSDLPFRQLCEQLGADFSVTEMTATAPQLLQTNKNQCRLHFTANARVNICQIIGNDARQMATAALNYAKQGADIIDINLGCPAKKINRKGAGSALLSDLSRVKNIVQTVTAACPVPVTIKTRLGPNHQCYTLPALAEIALDAGIELITVHGRTRACRFNGQAQFTEIAKLKQRFPQLAVIANGDIASVEQAVTVWRQTCCDGIMVGRGAVGKPWLFTELRQYFDKTFKPPIIDKKMLIVKHISAIHAFYGTEKGVRFARKHIQAYLKHLGQAHCFQALANITNPQLQLHQLQRHLNDII